MINFIIAARRKREDTQERYFYEWGIIHVALMITTPKVMRLFKRYVQHYSVSGITNDQLLFPLSTMEWDNMAEHIVETFDDFVASTRIEDYVARMQPHKFGDGNFVLVLATPTVKFERNGFARNSGGVKLVHFLKKKAGISDSEFDAAWSRHSDLLRDLEAADPRIHRYVQNRRLVIPKGNFQGSLFAAGDTEGFAGSEEFWFNDIEDLSTLARSRAWHEALTASYASFAESVESFSMVVTERVVYDYTGQTGTSPTASVLQEGSLEALVNAQGYSGWNVPSPIKSPRT